MQAHCEANLERTDGALDVGDVLLLRDMRLPAPTHLAIVGDYFAGGFSLIHAHAPSRRVIETRLDDAWRHQVVAAYRLPGVA